MRFRSLMYAQPRAPPTAPAATEDSEKAVRESIRSSRLFFSHFSLHNLINPAAADQANK
jgi:hypothetical protein